MRPSMGVIDWIGSCIVKFGLLCFPKLPLRELTLSGLFIVCKSGDPGEVMRTLGLSRWILLANEWYANKPINDQIKISMQWLNVLSHILIKLYKFSFQPLFTEHRRTIYTPRIIALYFITFINTKMIDIMKSSLCNNVQIIPETFST